MMPLVTIGVPVYNSQAFIIETLESIKFQTYQNIQLIIVDDCSTDKSLEIVKNWLQVNSQIFKIVTLIRNDENMGISYSCKMMEKKAEGVFFSLLGADDLLKPNKIDIQVQYLIENPHVALVYSNTLLIDNQGILMQNDYFKVQCFSCINDNIGPSGFVFDKLIVEDFIPASSVLVRKNILDSVGGFDETLFVEDWDLWLRICKTYPIHFMGGYYSLYRIHQDSVMRKKSLLVKVYLSSCKAVLKHRNLNKEFDRIIAMHINRYTIGMYRLGVINKELLRLNFLYNKTYKSAIYFFFGLLNIKVNQKK